MGPRLRNCSPSLPEICYTSRLPTTSKNWSAAVRCDQLIGCTLSGSWPRNRAWRAVCEAVKVLDVRGLVTVEPGRGAFVTDTGDEPISDHLGRLFRAGKPSHGDLNEFRRGLEVEISS
jgi:hypothetical protein